MNNGAVGILSIFLSWRKAALMKITDELLHNIHIHTLEGLRNNLKFKSTVGILHQPQMEKWNLCWAQLCLAGSQFLIQFNNKNCQSRKISIYLKEYTFPFMYTIIYGNDDHC